ncbi:MFS transporter [Kocuria flava]|uniref:MFS transporter n=1 Tax=Kocuria flava TaxID=446860 RepID=UPI001FF32DA0|nr:MFS transporter [Kocuria flava]MCJ8505303.1 MFS transporter [Kocuria flava]
MSFHRSRPREPGRDSARAYLVLGIGTFAYFSAVAQRTSFGVASVDAAERFGAAASVLSLFSLMQVLVYAALQVPVGVLVDRYGSRVLVAAGAALMVVGQVLLAAADTVPEGVTARVLVGAGDAATFVSVMRLIPAWFSPLRVPMLTQFLGVVGNLGQLVSVVPFAWALERAGWSPSLLSLAGLAALAAVLAAAVLRDAPPGTDVRRREPGLRRTGRVVRESLAEPGTRLGFWVHFTTQFAGNTFVLMWGYPYLEYAQGLPDRAVSVVMTSFVLTNVAVGLVLGRLTARRPGRRVRLALTVTGVIFAAWGVLLLWPGAAPAPVVLVAVCTIAISMPASLIAFDVARSFNPPHRSGTATGIVNVGGFTATVLAVLLTGLVLDALHAAGFRPDRYDPDAFRLAVAAQYLVAAAGAAGVLATARRVRHRHGPGRV